MSQIQYPNDRTDSSGLEWPTVGENIRNGAKKTLYTPDPNNNLATSYMNLKYIVDNISVTADGVKSINNRFPEISGSVDAETKEFTIGYTNAFCQPLQFFTSSRENIFELSYDVYITKSKTIVKYTAELPFNVIVLLLVASF